MPIRLRPGGTPEDRARTAKSVALANQLDAQFLASKPTYGTIIEAVGLLFAHKSKDFEQAEKFAKDISVAIDVCFASKENDK